ncbi:hypothetical protein [Granulicella sp. dw_53]|uniref:hypothetical protein n=1 Tax=Granulicella sp. dw_53 TaxID=2719792 RepID=UPI001BD5A145|nr:hypothetical protein [Granulicella sp. dw_53]
MKHLFGRIVPGTHRAFESILRVLCPFALTLLATASFGQSQPPSAEIDNGLIHARLYLPDTTQGFYRGTRFDWSGVIGSLTYAGHSFYDPWFTRTDPNVRDFVYEGSDIVAGPCSAITGPAEEFTSEGGALGYGAAAVGGTFVKIGVGVLRKPDTAKYSGFRLYDLVDAGKWTVKAKPNSVEFTQRVLDPASGYGYIYRKIVRLIPGAAQMSIEHSLQSIGPRPIETSVYDHNFLVLDHQPTGPDFTVTLPFAIAPTKPIDADFGAVEGKRILYRKQLQDKDRLTVHIAGFGNTAKDYDLTVDNAHAGAGVRITGDHPLESEELWSIRSVLAMEPYIHLSIPSGKTIHWRYLYSYHFTRQRKP